MPPPPQPPPLPCCLSSQIYKNTDRCIFMRIIPFKRDFSKSLNNFLIKLYIHVNHGNEFAYRNSAFGLPRCLPYIYHQFLSCFGNFSFVFRMKPHFAHMLKSQTFAQSCIALMHYNTLSGNGQCDCKLFLLLFSLSDLGIWMQLIPIVCVSVCSCTQIHCLHVSKSFVHFVRIDIYFHFHFHFQLSFFALTQTLFRVFVCEYFFHP